MMRLQQLFLAGLVLGQLPLAYGEDPTDDVIFKAINDELKRSMSLRLEDLDTPYFIQYEVTDSATHRVSAAYGALLSSDENRSRVLQSQVRVGSYNLDNSNVGGGPGGGGRSGLGRSTELPTDDDYMALRHAIWRTTDWQYKEAVATLTQKRAYLKERNVEDRPPDYVKADPISIIKDRATLSFQRTTWEEYVRRISAVFREYPHIQNSDVSLVAGVENRYLLNSEGSRLRDGSTETLLRITVEAQAEDGERFSDHLSYFAPTAEGVPALADVLAEAKRLATRMGATVQAPFLEEYTGPVLFDGLASAQLFRQLLGRGFAGLPDPVGTARRSAQGADDLDNRVGKRILPQTFQIYDDPRQEKFENTFLAGYYQFDDEAIAAQRVNIVVDGKLEGMVMSRAPTKLFAQTNGHGRRGGGEASRSALGCLYIESTKTESPENLKKALLDAADAEGLKFGLRISGIQSRAAGGGPGAFRRGGGRGAGRAVGDPISVYKVYVADGHEEPVRGCEFTSFDVQNLRMIIATGSVRTVQNNVIGATPSSSIIAPAVVIGEIELGRIKLEAEKKPILEAPHARRVQ
jgi:TldD protein